MSFSLLEPGFECSPLGSCYDGFAVWGGQNPKRVAFWAGGISPLGRSGLALGILMIGLKGSGIAAT